jgi:Skp family chaperone for outer membrane proteins
MNILNIPSRSLGLILAVAFSSLLMSCDNGSRQAALVAQEEVEALQKAKTKLEAEVKQVRENSEKAHADLLKKNDELQKEADEAKGQFEKLQDEAAKARKELEEYMAKYKLGYRAKLKGQTLASLQTTDSQNYQAVVLREVTPTEVSFAHSAGATRVAMEKLPADLQKKFMYDPEEGKRLAEAKLMGAKAIEGLEGVEGIEVVQKDPTRSVNPIVVQNLRNRMLKRQQEIDKARAEAAKVKNAGDDRTNLGKYRLQVLNQRAERMREEIKALANLLNKELNG